ncbi:MAG: glycoside hydrolase family 127 protein [Muribaculum sp.]|nr:glycoside hydrolase family 127 protein [Muribaculaceae bacterium]MCM1080336.1 glycoside hydrolase family 127 protein [Muribaculum sp.]
MKKLPGIFVMAVAIGTLALSAGNNMPYYKLTPVPVEDVELTDGLWQQQQKVAFGPAFDWVTYNFDRDNGGYRTFRLSDRRDTVKVEPVTSFESVKFLEAVGEYLKNHTDTVMEAYVDRCIDYWVTQQDKDGYFNGICTGVHQKQGKWNNLRWSHELYGVGHLLDAAVSYFQATGKRKMLDAALKSVDQVFSMFGYNKRHDVDGHEQIERAMTRYYELTGDCRFLETADFFIGQRGNYECRESYGYYAQDHVPFVEQHRAVGHAVRALYLYIAATDVVGATGNVKYRTSLDSLWSNMTSGHMYNTGAVGVNHSGIEGFAEEYDIAPDDTYGETCAAIATGVWAHKLNRLYADAKYMDMFERVTYNAFLSSLASDGNGIYYCNHVNQHSPERRNWPNCPCCPGNILSHYARMPGYIYSISDEGIYVNLFVASKANIRYGNGVELDMTTKYPYNGTINIEVNPTEKAKFTMFIRVPQWAKNNTIKVNGHEFAAKISNGYAEIYRSWDKGDKISVDFPMAVERQYMDKCFKGYDGLVALRRGPLVYTFEGVDNYGSVCNLVLPKSSDIKSLHSDEFGGIIKLVANGRVLDWDGSWKSRTLTAIPCNLHSNRGTSVHYIWVAEQPEKACEPIFHLNSMDLSPQQ